MASRSRFEKLMEPGNIGRVRTRNRIIKTASGGGLVEKDGTAGETIRSHYEALAKGGVGLIIFEFCTVEWPRGSNRPGLVGATIHDDKYIPGYSELTKTVHKHGCPIFIQLYHSGMWYIPGEGNVDPGDKIAVSVLTEDDFPTRELSNLSHSELSVGKARELTLADIEELIQTFGRAAERAQKAGFDGVELNSSHFHLLNSFLSRFWNRRQDEYGCGTPENRTRFLCQVIREIKKRCGEGFAVETLINGTEYGLKNGITLEEAKKTAQLLQEGGADAIQVRTEGYGNLSDMLHSDRFFYPELSKDLIVEGLDYSRKGKGMWVPLGAEIKKVVSIPVFVAGRLDPELGEEILRRGKLDFIGMTRRLLADPELPNKVAEGRLEDIAPCSGCLYCWHEKACNNRPIRCRINAALGREGEFEIKSAEKKKKVLVAGSGPAGMEAARVAALRGHEVILYEKERRLGGLLPLAAIVKDLEFESILNTIHYFKNQMTKLNVKIELGREVNLSEIKKINPDVIIIAIGGINAIPQIPGIKSRKVLNSDKLHRKLKLALRFLGPKAIEQLTKWWMPIGNRVVIIGGALAGCQLAEFLVKRGRKVTIVDTAKRLGDGLLANDPTRLFKWFHQKGVAIMAEVKYEEITEKGLVITTKDGERKILEADTIITSLPLLPSADLLKSLEGKIPEVYQIGDCRESGFIHSAIADGSRIARMI
jgi:2,4-dienoyl-CoA reductase (NADPH2)